MTVNSALPTMIENIEANNNVNTFSPPRFSVEENNAAATDNTDAEDMRCAAVSNH